MISAPIANATMALSNEAQGYLVFMFFVMSYCGCTGGQLYSCCRRIPLQAVIRNSGSALDVGTMWGCSILLGAAARHFISIVVYRLFMLY